MTEKIPTPVGANYAANYARLKMDSKDPDTKAGAAYIVRLEKLRQGRANNPKSKGSKGEAALMREHQEHCKLTGVLGVTVAEVRDKRLLPFDVTVPVQRDEQVHRAARG